MASSATKKNHFVPCFYSRLWALDGKRLCEFSRPHISVVARRVHPEATGYSKNLYTASSLPPGIQTYLEDSFLKKVDQRAHDALGFLLKGDLDGMSDALKISWVRFIMSMMQRSPNRISALQKQWTEQYLTVDDEIEARYQAERTPDRPKTAREYMANSPPETKERGMVRLLQSVMDLPNVGQHMVNMRWAIITLESEKYSLLTSDRPVMQTNGLLKADGHLGIPIGPTQIFLCANNIQTLKTIAAIPRDRLIQQTNDVVSRQAEQFVYGTTDKALSFVAKRLTKVSRQMQ